MTLEEKVKYYEEALRQLESLYMEKRSDVSDIAGMALNHQPLDALHEIVEHRYVCYSHNGVEYQYDTLTTLVEYKDPQSGEWLQVKDIQYKND